MIQNLRNVTKPTFSGEHSHINAPEHKNNFYPIETNSKCAIPQ